jgi:ribose 5-phosphate isomerase B
VAKLVGDGAAERGILIDGAGIGSAMAANKVPGVRAANCNTREMAVNAREHNDANVLTLGAKMADAATALEIVRIFLTTACTEARHQKRVRKIMEIEARYLKR